MEQSILREKSLNPDTLANGLAELRTRTSMEPVIGDDGKAVMTRGRVHMILTKLEKYTSIVGTAIQHSPEITSLVWAGMRLVLDVSWS